MKSFERIAVLGTGAIGSSLAADLSRAGRAPTLIDQWPDHVEAMRERGLTIAFRDADTFTVPVRAMHLCDLASARQRFDLVFLASKSNDTR